MQNEEQQQPFYFWAENLEEYESDNLAYDKGKSENPVIEIKRLNFFIGKNNSGKSRFLRRIFSGRFPIIRSSDGQLAKDGERFERYFIGDWNIKNQTQYLSDSGNELHKLKNEIEQVKKNFHKIS